jgi:type IV pilus assembly protein PilV
MGNLSARGFTLIEVLIVLCLLSLQAIGIIDLQWRSLRAARESALQSAAMQLAADMADGLRAAPAGSDPMAAPGFDDWQAGVATALPGGRAIICHDAAPWDEAAGAYRWDCGDSAGPLVIKIGWNDSGGATAPASPRLVLTVAPARS